MDAPQHLADLFKVGTLHTVEFDLGDDKFSFDLWIRKPTAEQQGEARAKAQAQSARLKARYRDKESDAYTALWGEITDLESKDGVIDKLLDVDAADRRSKAFNEVMYAEEHGGDWTEAGEDYFGTVTAMTERFEEIDRHNAALPSEDQELRIAPKDDEELQNLQVKFDEFQSQVEERYNQLIAHERAQLDRESEATLREKLVKAFINVESQMAWYQEYRVRMLHYACRYPDDRKRLYFRHRNDILELPVTIQSDLFTALDALTSTDPKEQAILQSSFLS